MDKKMNFADVNAEKKLQLALIRITQLEDELKAQMSRTDGTAREDSAMDYAFMFSSIESCDINRLSPEGYIRKLILDFHEKKQKLPCYIGL